MNPLYTALQGYYTVTLDSTNMYGLNSSHWEYNNYLFTLELFLKDMKALSKNKKQPNTVIISQEIFNRLQATHDIIKDK